MVRSVGPASRHQLREAARPGKKGNDHDHQTTGRHGRGAPGRYRHSGHAATQAHHPRQRAARRPGRRDARGHRKASNQASTQPQGEPTGDRPGRGRAGDVRCPGRLRLLARKANRTRECLGRLGSGASGSHQAGRGRIPGRRERPAPGLDHGLQRDHGGLGPAVRRRPGPALPRRDLRQRRSGPYPAAAGAAHHRRHGRPDQRSHQHSRPGPGERPRLVDGGHDRPGPGASAPHSGAAPGAVRHLPGHRHGAALPGSDTSDPQRRTAGSGGRSFPSRSEHGV